MDNQHGTVANFTATIGTNTRITIPPEARRIVDIKPRDIVYVRIEKVKSGEKHNNPGELPPGAN